jgi:hypothetical protein
MVPVARGPLLCCPLVVPFPYYSRLSRRDQAIYRQSDVRPRIDLPEPERLRPLAAEVAAALEADDRRAVQRAGTQLVGAIFAALGTSPVKLRVLAVRPSRSDHELHGLYEREDGKPALIRVWMRTASHGRVVRFRTFLRTLMHEVCHHLDYEWLGLADSFHTEGFFRRESSLMRQLVPGARDGEGPRGSHPRAVRRRGRAEAASEPERRRRQLELPLD